MRSDDPFDLLVAATNPAMVVVTAAAGHDRDGCLVGFHCQCSIEPRRYAVWLSVVNHTYHVAEQVNVLGVHFLAVEQRELAVLFGGVTADHETDKLAGVSWTPGPEGVPLLDDVAHRFVGRVVARGELDCDHVLYELEPVAGEGSYPSTLNPLRLREVWDIGPGHPIN